MSARHAALGIDIGATRARVAIGVQDGDCVRVRAVAARDLPTTCVDAKGIAQPELVAAVLEDAIAELGSTNRRCVLSLGSAEARLGFVRFPSMPPKERRRAAHFEAERFNCWDRAVSTVVRVHPFAPDASLHAVGIARWDALTMKTTCAKRAGLRPVAVDSDSLAYRRAFPSHDAVLDVGYAATTLHVYSGSYPASTQIAGGGTAMTQAVAADLSIDVIAAEKRKRMLGTAGAGEGG